MAVAMQAQGWIPEDNFGHRLVLIRRQLGISQEEAALKCGLKPATWATWENGARPRGEMKVIQQIVDALGCDRDWLAFGGPLPKNRCSASLSLVPALHDQAPLPFPAVTTQTIRHLHAVS